MQQRTAKEMIQFLPNYKYIAFRLRVSVPTVQNWVMWNYIGRESRMEFFELLKEFGFPNASYAEIIKLEKKLPKNEKVAKC